MKRQQPLVVILDDEGTIHSITLAKDDDEARQIADKLMKELGVDLNDEDLDDLDGGDGVGDGGWSAEIHYAAKKPRLYKKKTQRTAK